MREVFTHSLVNVRDAVLVDYGCGLGRTLLFASTLTFKKIIGVELSPMLCAAATKNLEQHYIRQHKTQPEWRVVNIDARRFDIPDDANIFYFFNPFDTVVLAEVIDMIIELFLTDATQLLGGLCQSDPRNIDVVART